MGRSRSAAHCALVLATLWLAATGNAEEAARPPAAPVVEAAVPDAALPSTEMLMYFAEFEDADGDFVDPLALESDAAKDLSTSADEVIAHEKPDEANPHTD